MADVFDSAKRSEIMSRIRSANTEAERIVFSELGRRKIYFQKHYKRAAGKPDIALPRKKIAVFIDGDFWHGRQFERMLRTRPAGDYWIRKLEYNITRDKQQLETLMTSGWSVLRVWESDIKRKRTRQENVEKIIKFLTKSKP
jgi:DNA mismatch endonuclease (patch repair protein)